MNLRQVLRGLLVLLCVLATVSSAPLACAQMGDHGKSTEPASAQDFPIPPAPPLSPSAALRTFKVAPGFHIELVASEPLISTPVAMAFDLDGRIWVCEMNDYMLDVDGTGENQPTDRIVILEDSHGDGKMDKRTVFLDNLVLPRAVAFMHGGVLVGEPPHLWLCSLPGPDGKPTEKTELLSDFGSAGADPEYQPNGLLWAMDNWIYNARSTRRYRFDDTGKLTSESTALRGQWGITQDDAGRLFYNYNSEQVRSDVIPFDYLRRNPNYHQALGVNVGMVHGQELFPSRVNPGVNRGYDKGILRPNGTLRYDTAACGPTIYRGDLFPPDCRGNAFVCEPAANLVRRSNIERRNLQPLAINACPGTEFLTSTDERFRPVSLYTGPDGALYIADMYRGLIQYKNYLTTYLRNQTLSRGLDKPVDQGRIYRVVPDGVKLDALPKLRDRSTAALIARLSHPNGWWRDTAQRLLVEGGDPDAAPLLAALARDKKAPAAGRLQALWTLQGLHKLDVFSVTACLSSGDADLRAGAIRLSEGFLAKNPDLPDRLLALSGDAVPEVRLQVALSLGQVPGAAMAPTLTAMLAQESNNRFIRSAVISGIRGHEFEALTALLKDPRWSQAAPPKSDTLGALARCVLEEKNPGRVERMFQLIASQPAETSWRRDAMLSALSDAAVERERKGKADPVPLPAPSRALASLGTNGDAQTRDWVVHLNGILTWPGKAPVASTAPEAPPLTAAQRVLFENGKTAFEKTCAACHQPSGQGQAGLAPPLVNSEWVLGPSQRLIRIALHGLAGSVEVEGKTFDLEMPPMGSLSDEDLAGILTFIRHRWGNAASAVESDQVAKVRRETEARAESWTAAELLAVP